MVADKIIFQSIEDAEEYWNKHYGGQHKDPNIELARMERWCDGVVIMEPSPEPARV